MSKGRDVVITGLGAVTSLGVGTDSLWSHLCSRSSGIVALPWFGNQSDLGSHSQTTIGGLIPDFEPKAYVRPRKALKVMCRELATAFTASQFAFENSKLEASLEAGLGDRQRVGTVFGSEMLYGSPDEMASTMQKCLDASGNFDSRRFGQAAMQEIYPLWMLRYLPNMAACHVGIAVQVFGPNNTLVQGDTSGPAAAIESASVIQRGVADAMISGATGTRVSPTGFAYRRDRPYASLRDPITSSSRPFAADADGVVNAEGAATLVLEDAEFCEKRSGKPLARLLGSAVRFAPSGNQRGSATSIQQAIQDSLTDANCAPEDVALVVSHAMGDPQQDLAERKALLASVPDTPVTAPIGAMGHSGAAVGMIQLTVGVLSLVNQSIPPTLNVDGIPSDFSPRLAAETRKLSSGVVLCITHTAEGQATAIVLGQA